MRYVAAYLLLALGGKANPTSAEIEKVLSSVGIEADKEKLEKVLSELKGKNVEQLIEEGKGKLASVPSGGAAVAAAAGGAGGGGAPAAGGSPEKKKEEEKKDEEEESDDDMGFGLFD